MLATHRALKYRIACVGGQASDPGNSCSHDSGRSRRNGFGGEPRTARREYYRLVQYGREYGRKMCRTVS